MKAAMSTAAGVGRFELVSSFTPKGDQPPAIESLANGIEAGQPAQTLLGITGSGKTFTMASVVARVQRPTLVIAPNKTLAAQLYAEFRDLFPASAVEYFVSYYDYYQPEAYLPRTDTYIEKDASINQQIERMRNSATRSLIERRDVIIVASVSCIYGLGDPDAYEGMRVEVHKGGKIDREELLRRLAIIQYQRNQIEFRRGAFRSRGDVIEIFPAYEEALSFRIETLDDEVEALLAVDPLTGEVVEERDSIAVYPASHYVTPKERLDRAVVSIEAELEERLIALRATHKLLEAQRLEQRTRFDLELLRETGFCSGIENYSRHLDGRSQGEPPATLINYFPEDLLVMIDESHISVPQIGAMYRGDRSRKETLVEHGFRLPSALDNRPLRFDEFERLVRQCLYVSATPAAYEVRRSQGQVIEQIIRPTGLLDPGVEVRPVRGQVEDLLSEIRTAASKKERVLVTTLTKRMAEELTEYYRSVSVRVRYLHSDIDTIERTEVLHDLRAGKFDVLVGINLLREGLDLPEVALVAVLDADKEGFLRSSTSLIQTFGRAARNVNGRVILYADVVTGSMRTAIDETRRRHLLQKEYNQRNGIVPQTVRKDLSRMLDRVEPWEEEVERAMPGGTLLHPKERKKKLEELRRRMFQAAERLEFEKAAELRDEVRVLELADLKLR